MTAILTASPGLVKGASVYPLGQKEKRQRV